MGKAKVEGTSNQARTVCWLSSSLLFAGLTSIQNHSLARLDPRQVGARRGHSPTMMLTRDCSPPSLLRRYNDDALLQNCPRNSDMIFESGTQTRHRGWKGDLHSQSSKAKCMKDRREGRGRARRDKTCRGHLEQPAVLYAFMLL